MSFFKKLAGLFAGVVPRDRNAYWVSVQCQRCGEIVRTRINLNNDLSAEFDEGGTTTYLCRKTLLGKERCFQPIEVTLIFDAGRRLRDRQVTGGKFVDEANLTKA